MDDTNKNKYRKPIYNSLNWLANVKFDKFLINGSAPLPNNIDRLCKKHADIVWYNPNFKSESTGKFYQCNLTHSHYNGGVYDHNIIDNQSIYQCLSLL